MWQLVSFVQVFMHALWWLQRAEITTGSSIVLSRARTSFSMLDPAPMTILLVHARSFIHKTNKSIYFRQHHMFMNIRRIRKKRKYLIIELTCACSSDWSSMCNWRRCGCNISSRDVLIIFGPLLQGATKFPPIPPYIQPLGRRLDLGFD